MIPLSQTMRDLLARACVVAEGPTARIDPNKTGGHSKPGGVAPRGAERTLGDRMVERWAVATNEGECRRAERDCEQMLWVVVRTRPPEKGLREPGSLPWKREIAQEAAKVSTAEEVGVIAKRFSISRASVYRYKALYLEEEDAA